MTTTLIRCADDCIAEGAAESTLAASLLPRNALALWRRPLPEPLRPVLRDMALDAVDDLDFAIALPIAPATLALKLALAGYEEQAAMALAEDILRLARVQAEISGMDRLRIRLEVVESDGCWKFHADYVTRRLLTTYVGQGTQWAPAGDRERIGQMAAGEVGIFKGRLLLPEPPVLHRSPPIGDSGEQRLLLAIDPAAEG